MRRSPAAKRERTRITIGSPAAAEETREYVPMMIAAARIGKEPRSTVSRMNRSQWEVEKGPSTLSRGCKF